MSFFDKFKKGAEDLKKAAEDTGAKIKEGAEEAGEKAKKFAGEAQEKIKEGTSEAGEKAKEFGAKAKGLIDDNEEKIESSIDKVADKFDELTGGKFADKVDKVQDYLKDNIGEPNEPSSEA